MGRMCCCVSFLVFTTFIIELAVSANKALQTSQWSYLAKEDIMLA